MKTIPHCLLCGMPVSWGVHLFSRRLYGHCLCLKDQCYLEESGATAQVVDLYLALRSHHIPVELKPIDGYQYADIAVPGRLHIVIKRPKFNGPKKIIKDLNRPFDSRDKNFLTILISHSVLENTRTFELAVREITKVCKQLLKKPRITGLQFSFSSSQWQ